MDEANAPVETDQARHALGSTAWLDALEKAEHALIALMGTPIDRANPYALHVIGSVRDTMRLVQTALEYGSASNVAMSCEGGHDSISPQQERHRI